MPSWVGTKVVGSFWISSEPCSALKLKKIEHCNISESLDTIRFHDFILIFTIKKEWKVSTFGALETFWKSLTTQRNPTGEPSPCSSSFLAQNSGWRHDQREMGVFSGSKWVTWLGYYIITFLTSMVQSGAKLPTSRWNTRFFISITSVSTASLHWKLSTTTSLTSISQAIFFNFNFLIEKIACERISGVVLGWYLDGV